MPRPGSFAIIEREVTGVGVLRQPHLEDLFELIDDSFLLGSSHGRYDLSDYNDRYQFRMEVVHNQRSSDESSQWIKRRFYVLRRKGVPHQQGRGVRVRRIGPR
jgi:hypothetical protein